MSFDFARSLRRLKPHRLTGRMARRKLDDLPIVGPNFRPGPELLLDTTVYVDRLKNQVPPEVNHLLAASISNHSAICLSELTHVFGRLDPRHPGTNSSLEAVGKIIAAMQPHRLREPSLSAWGAAGILTGLAFRVGGYQKGTERKLLNDALLFMQALENGHAVLTANAGDFDILNQLIPEGRILIYRSKVRA